MKKSDFDDLQAARARKKKRFSLIVWLIIGPCLFTFLLLLFTQPKPPAHVLQHGTSACQQAKQEQAILGNGGSIAPLCDQSPDPQPPPDGG